MKNSTLKILLIGCLGIGFFLLLFAGVAGLFVYGYLAEGYKGYAGGYKVSGGRVFYNAGAIGLNPNGTWKEVENADAATFSALNEGYAKDKNSGFFEGYIIPDSSGKTFKVVGKDYAKDQAHAFYQRYRISDLPDNFKFIAENEKGVYATDGQKVFIRSSELFPETLDAATFELIGATGYFKDKNHVYSVDKMLEDSDPATFKVLPDFAGVFTQDKNHVYFKDNLVKDCDPATHKILTFVSHRDANHIFFGADKLSDDAANFQVLTANYSKDSKNVYWGMDKISADAATFTAFPSIGGTAYGKDSKNVYWGDLKMPKADVASFVGLDHYYAKDKNHVYFGVGSTDIPKPIEKVDAATFELTGGEYDGRDKDNIIHFGSVLRPRSQN